MKPSPKNLSRVPPCAEHDLARAGMEAAQERHHPLGRQPLREGREADDVGEQHRDLARRRRAEALGRAPRQRIGDVGRHVAGEVRPRHLGPGLPLEGAAGAPDRRRQEGRDDGGERELVPQGADPHIGGVEDDREGLVAGGRRALAHAPRPGDGVVAAIDRQEPGRPDRHRAQAGPQHRQGRVGEGGAGEIEEEVEDSPGSAAASGSASRPPRRAAGWITAAISARSSTMKPSLIGSA